MMARPVAQVLIRFGSTEHQEGAGPVSRDTACPDPLDDLPAEDFALAIQLAREDGVTEGFAKARTEYEAQFMQESLAFEARLATERETWTRQESEMLSGKIEAMFAEIESNIAGSVARVLRPFVADALRRRIIDLLGEHVGALLRGSECPVIEISGREDLLAMLREKLSAFSCAIHYTPEDSSDLRVVAGQTIIESQIGAWIERINSLPE
jgi:hypothetical protein